ncbi:GYDIA family GHMP kinase [Robertkochia solimangrovi]|uniref:GYDIA family GHMP kinase n=1 Tax=Robertkochia solimangrovi TaxID=2213046 RepID=UPI001180DE0C|nr:GYDIA family GHMP kinase [Robertkochia solimangrovi]TRZ43251.1 GHMP kinase [Robertkochia solimangrovi]
MKEFYSHGKLLLSAEYLVLDGALALAIPTCYGQSMSVSTIPGSALEIFSYDKDGALWFEGQFNSEKMIALSENLPDVFAIKKVDLSSIIISTNASEPAQALAKILITALFLNPGLSHEIKGKRVANHLEFPTNWGLGSSSTLVSNIALWTHTDPYLLLQHSFGGSGYDLACARSESPLTYRITTGKPEVKPVEFNPPFKDQLFFVHLNQKQNSRSGIKAYHQNKKNTAAAIKEIEQITNELIITQDLARFRQLMDTHEEIIAEVTGQETVKNHLFKDYQGSIKSLGAWGGDFILATGTDDGMSYFRDKGYKTILSYSEMTL